MKSVISKNLFWYFYEYVVIDSLNCGARPVIEDLILKTLTNLYIYIYNKLMTKDESF